MVFGRSWGPQTWYLFHILSLTWEKKNIDNYIEFFKLISKTIPCGYCSMNFKKEISNHNLSISRNCDDKERMIKWLIYLHNRVNKRNKKKQYTVEEVLNLHIKDGNLYINNYYIIRFIQEYVIYNINIGKRKKGLHLLFYLAKIYPNINKRMNLILFIKQYPNPNKNLKKWINTYIKIIK